MSNPGRAARSARLAEREAPRWLIVVSAIVGVAVLAYFGCRAVVGREGEPGPRIGVHPGMYDLRAEVAKMRAAHAAESAANGR